MNILNNLDTEVKPDHAQWLVTVCTRPIITVIVCPPSSPSTRGRRLMLGQTPNELLITKFRQTVNVIVLDKFSVPNIAARKSQVA